MRSIPPGGSMPPGIRAQRRIRAHAGIGVASGSRTPRPGQSSWDGNIEKHAFKGSRRTSSARTSPHIYEEIRVYREAIREIEENITELRSFGQEGLQVEVELARLLEQKQHLEQLLERAQK